MEMRHYRFVHSLLVAVFLSTVFAMSSNVSAEDYVIIVNNAVPDEQISVVELRNIFLAKKRQWSNGKKIMISHYKDSDLQDEFLTKEIKKSRTKFEIYWKKLVFTGKAAMPKRAVSEEDIVAYVKSTPGAIGFVSSKTNITGTKTLKIIR